MTTHNSNYDHSSFTDGLVEEDEKRFEIVTDYINAAKEGFFDPKDSADCSARLFLPGLEFSSYSPPADRKSSGCRR